MYDNIFMNPSLCFCNETFQPDANQVKFSRKPLGKRVRRHINTKSVTLNV